MPAHPSSSSPWPLPSRHTQDKLQMEESNTAVNLLKVNDGWRSILRQARTAELRHDVTVLSQTFERHLDGLDCLLHNLEVDIQKADQQAAEVRCIHVRNLKRLQEVQNKRLRILQQQWESGLQLLTSKFNSERSAGHRAHHPSTLSGGLHDHHGLNLHSGLNYYHGLN